MDMIIQLYVIFPKKIGIEKGNGIFCYYFKWQNSVRESVSIVRKRDMNILITMKQGKFT